MRFPFRKLVVCFALGFGSVIGVPMRPEEIQELLRDMNVPRVETTVPKRDDEDDPLKRYLRARGIKLD
jgi:hypothetical protein